MKKGSAAFFLSAILMLVLYGSTGCAGSDYYQSSSPYVPSKAFHAMYDVECSIGDMKDVTPPRIMRIASDIIVNGENASMKSDVYNDGVLRGTMESYIKDGFRYYRDYAASAKGSQISQEFTRTPVNKGNGEIKALFDPFSGMFYISSYMGNKKINIAGQDLDTRLVDIRFRDDSLDKVLMDKGLLSVYTMLQGGTIQPFYAGDSLKDVVALKQYSCRLYMSGDKPARYEFDLLMTLDNARLVLHAPHALVGHTDFHYKETMDFIETSNEITIQFPALN